MKSISLTGIKPTGSAHIGNYFGAILPAIHLARTHEARYFIADYHALNSEKNPHTLRRHVIDIAATWLACGLEEIDTDKIFFYRQSSVLEIFELSTILMNVTAKGLMNRAHAYKALVAENQTQEKDHDKAVNMGLYTYPILMAADILLFDADIVPIGADQQQHLEIAADIAMAFNHQYGNGEQILKPPKPFIKEPVATITGTDGRKMSKSYNNTLPLFADSSVLKKSVMKIVTDSLEVTDVKNPDTCSIFALYKLFATKDEQANLRTRYLNGGMGYGHAKIELLRLMTQFLQPMKKKYDALINDEQTIHKLLAIGNQKAREVARQKMQTIRRAVGIT